MKTDRSTINSQLKVVQFTVKYCRNYCNTAEIIAIVEIMKTDRTGHGLRSAVRGRPELKAGPVDRRYKTKGSYVAKSF